VQVRAESRLKKLPGLSKFNQVSVTMRETTATLKGVVVSDRDKRFVEKLVMLEPGVKKIDNQLAVKAAD
jgi:osmotically-inducible protein OsmY